MTKERRSGAKPGMVRTQQHYRQRAKDLREIAKGIFDPKERKMLIDIAEEYGQLARSTTPNDV